MSGGLSFHVVSEIQQCSMNVIGGCDLNNQFCASEADDIHFGSVGAVSKSSAKSTFVADQII